MRKRLFSSLDSETNGSNTLRGRVARELPHQEAALSAVPLSQILKRDWAAGTLSSKKVQECCAGAVAEGSMEANARVLREALPSATAPAQHSWTFLEDNFLAAQSRFRICESGTAEVAAS